MNGKVQKHANFQKELTANKARIDEVISTGKQLIESGHYGSERVDSRLEEILLLWQQLVEAADKKESRLSEASQQQQFNRTVEDIEVWLGEVEASLNSEDYGKDLTSVQNLQKKHGLLESDVSSHQERVDSVIETAREFIDRGHFDGDSIKRKAEGVEKRYAALQAPIQGMQYAI